MARTRAAAVAVLLLVAVAACSGGGGGSTKSGPGTSFADATCSDLAEWAAALQPAFTDLQAAANLDISNADAAKAQLQKLSSELSAAEQATGKLADGINSRPAPDIASGDQIKTTLVATLNQLRDLGTQTRTQIDQFDVANATPESAAALHAALQALTTNVADSLTALTPLLSGNEELRSALENSAACKAAGSQFATSS